jgi:hypothetical protein
MEQRKTIEYVLVLSPPGSSTYLTRSIGSLYSGIDPSTQPATTQTAYKWSFASNKSRVDNDALRVAREAVGAATYGRDLPSTSSSSSSRIQGPTLPTPSDMILAREAASDLALAERDYTRKRDKQAAKERVEDMVGPKEVGKEGMLEKKRAKREGDRSFRERGDDGFVEADEGTLMGGGDSFKERCVYNYYYTKASLLCSFLTF